MTGVTGGSVLTFAFSATLEGAGTTTADLTLTARQSRVMAVLAGPRGDVLVRWLPPRPVLITARSCRLAVPSGKQCGLRAAWRRLCPVTLCCRTPGP